MGLAVHGLTVRYGSLAAVAMSESEPGRHLNARLGTQAAVATVESVRTQSRTPVGEF